MYHGIFNPRVGQNVPKTLKCRLPGLTGWLGVGAYKPGGGVQSLEPL